MRGVEGFAQGIGLDLMKAWELYQAGTQETEPSEANRDGRQAEVWKRMLAAARRA